MYEVFDNEVGKGSIEEHNGMLFVHYKSKVWGPSVYKKLLQTWALVLTTAKQMGHEYVYVLIPDNDPKLYKFERMFCLEEVDRIDNNILMRKAT
jgi:hypothetical protein